ncbi:MAG: D-glycero-alpha-D-manno-heptose-1,7-bisphosphate 7-phosphatase [Lautropia sp.]
MNPASDAGGGATGARPAGDGADPRPAVFIDRDGTLNVHRGYVRRPEELEVFPFAGAALRRLADAGWVTVLVTNQAILGRGECTWQTMDAIHRKLAVALARDGARLDAIRICPHATRGGSGRPRIATCDCRKPLPGLILAAARELRLDLARSWTVGDSTSDIAAGRSAGTQTILVETGQAGADRLCDVAPDRVARDFAAAVDIILG